MKNLIEGIQGKWKVTGYGIAKLINPLGDIKYIAGTNGFNSAMGINWGFFKVEHGYSHATSALILNYNDHRNNSYLRKVHDVIIKDKDGWTGTFYYKKKEVFTFRLDRSE